VETIILISDWIARLLDYPLGWLLMIPRDLAIVIVAVGTSLVLTLARKWTTDQGRLARAKNDLARLAQLRREAKQRRDKTTLANIRATVGMIKLNGMKAEGKPMLLSIVPIALLAIWALARLDYYAPQPDDVLKFEANYPVSSIGRLSHIVAPEGMEVTEPVQVVREDKQLGGEGIALWAIRPVQEMDRAEIIVRHGDNSVTVPFTAGGVVYEAPIQMHDGKITATMVHLRQAKFLEGILGFGGVPGINIIMFPPWLVAYLIITIIFVPLLRKGLKIY
jgi:uncharacterized membrane protein (DUF106 family)